MYPAPELRTPLGRRHFPSSPRGFFVFPAPPLLPGLVPLPARGPGPIDSPLAAVRGSPLPGAGAAAAAALLCPARAGEIAVTRVRLRQPSRSCSFLC